ncbi:biotin/lipoyl-containing protein [Chondromyces apiculatus]|uniref:biotin/lipoyl-containing protein n=1 Tax=Chondromyces apiculatus TaxID=51 RepID=UPI001E3293C4|nr:biotin/lipoyl-containing protein [Chondromyces apiculatus]
MPSGREIPVDVSQLPSGRLQAALEGRTVDVDAFGSGTATHLLVEGRGVDLWLEGTPPQLGVVASGQRYQIKVESERSRDAIGISKAQGQGAGLLRSPMPGRVLKVLVQEGDTIRAGQPLVVVEAMKMENELAAERDGVVKQIFVSPGATVEGGARLLEVD